MPPARKEEMEERAGQIMHYLLFNGPVFADGDTMSLDENFSTQVRHEKTPDGGINYVIPL